MKKTALLAFFALGLFCSCSNESDASFDEVTIRLNLPEQQLINADGGESTRISYVDESTTLKQATMKRYYEYGDNFGILPKTGDSQIRFTVQDDKTSSIILASGAWNVKAGNTYVCYFPYALENQDATAIPFSYTGQVQTGNSNTDHLSKFVFITSDVQSSETGEFHFELGNAATLVKFILTVPNGGTFSKMTLEASEANKIFLQSGTIDLFAEGQPFTALKSSSSYTLQLQNVTIENGGTNEPLVLYAMFGDCLKGAGIPLAVTLYDNAGNKYSATKTFGANLERGKAYYTSITMGNPEQDNSLGTLTGTVQ